MDNFRIEEYYKVLMYLKCRKEPICLGCEKTFGQARRLIKQKKHNCDDLLETHIIKVREKTMKVLK